MHFWRCIGVGTLTLIAMGVGLEQAVGADIVPGDTGPKLSQQQLAERTRHAVSPHFIRAPWDPRAKWLNFTTIGSTGFMITSAAGVADLKIGDEIRVYNAIDPQTLMGQQVIWVRLMRRDVDRDLALFRAVRGRPSVALPLGDPRRLRSGSFTSAGFEIGERVDRFNTKNRIKALRPRLAPVRWRRTFDDGVGIDEARLSEPWSPNRRGEPIVGADGRVYGILGGPVKLDDEGREMPIDSVIPLRDVRAFLEPPILEVRAPEVRFEDAGKPVKFRFQVVTLAPAPSNIEIDLDIAGKTYGTRFIPPGYEADVVALPARERPVRLELQVIGGGRRAVAQLDDQTIDTGSRQIRLSQIRRVKPLGAALIVETSERRFAVTGGNLADVLAIQKRTGVPVAEVKTVHVRLVDGARPQIPWRAQMRVGGKAADTVEGRVVIADWPASVLATGDSTVAYWRFEDVEDGLRLVGVNASSRDETGNGNRVGGTSFETAPLAWDRDRPGRVALTGQPNRRFIELHAIKRRWAHMIGGPPPPDKHRWATPVPTGEGLRVDRGVGDRWTIEASIRHGGALAQEQTVLCLDDPKAKQAGQAVGVRLYLDADARPCLEVFDDKGERHVIRGGGAVAPHHWRHLAATCDGESITLYIERDGTYVSVDKAPIGGAARRACTRWLLGRGPGSGRPPVTPLVGAIDEVRISRDALSPDRMLFHDPH